MTESISPTNIIIDNPVTHQDFRRDYIHGPDSLLRNLPHPKVYSSTTHNQCVYSFTKVKDCISHFLASGGQLFSPEATPYSSRMVEDEKWKKIARVLFSRP